ncbi:MAG TPA: glycine oxidase ThiO, partial [Candidatus Caenarcaniphilales bacterium]
LRSRELYPGWAHKLEALTGLNPEYWPCGILSPVYAEDGACDSLALHEHYPAANRQWLNQSAIHQHQPGLSSQVVGGWWYPEDAQVDNRSLAQVLWAAAKQLGVQLCEGIAVDGLRYQQNRVVGVETTAGGWQAEQYLLATGAWSSELLPVPVVPRKGQMLSVRVPREGQEVQPLRQVLFGTQIYIVPRHDGRIVIGATSEDVGFTPNNTPAGIQSLLGAAMKLYPEIRDFPTQEFWWGFRPATPDEWPILGPSSWANLTLATGHYRNGILLAPVTAALITNLILHQKFDPLLTHFHWERFGGMGAA